jgi:hypothetical protein
MSGETNIQDPDDQDLKKPLQKSDLMGPTVLSNDTDNQEEEIEAIKDEKLITEKVDKAPQGYKSIRGIAKELGISFHTVSSIIKKVDGLSPVKARFNNTLATAYSPEDVERIREVAESQGLFSSEAPEGYMSIKGIHKELNITEAAIKKITSEHDSIVPIKARLGTNITDAYSPEDIERIREVAESKGLFSAEAPEGYLSIRGISKALGVDAAAIKRITSGLEGLIPVKARFGDKVADSYSPEDIARIAEALEAKKNKS